MSKILHIDASVRAAINPNPNHNSISKNISYGVLINLSLFIKDSLLKETLYKYIDFYSKNINFQVSTKEIVKEVDRNKQDLVVAKIKQWLFSKC